jgi:hypothetical protein
LITVILKLASSSSNLVVLPPRWRSDALPDVHPPKCCLKVQGRGESLSSVESFSWMQPGTCSSRERCHDDLPSLDPTAFAARPDGQKLARAWPAGSTSAAASSCPAARLRLARGLSSRSIGRVGSSRHHRQYILSSSPVIHSGIRWRRGEGPTWEGDDGDRRHRKHTYPAINNGASMMRQRSEQAHGGVKGSAHHLLLFLHVGCNLQVLHMCVASNDLWKQRIVPV